MSLLIRTLLIAVVAGFAVPAARADEPKVKKPQPGAEAGKPVIIQIDASKLPPEVLKELLKLSKPTDATKPEPTKPVTKPATTKPGIKPEPTKPGTKPDATKPVTKPEPTKPGTKPDVTKPGTKPEPTKPGTKPDQGKPVIKPDTTKPGVKPDTTKVVKTISLGDAVAIAEKLTKGTVVKAEREDGKDGSVQFVLDVLDSKSGKSKIVLDADGDVLKTDSQGGDDKGKGKVKIK